MKYKNNAENDATLAAAFTLAGETEEDIAPPEGEIKFSAEHEAKMQKLFAAEYKRQRRKQLRAYASRAAVIFVAAVLAVGISVGSVEAWRVRVINFIQDRTEEYTEIKFTESPVASYSVDGITLNYIPEGYRLVGDSSKPGEYTSLEFQNDESSDITFKCKQTSSRYTKKFDTENAVVTEFEYRGCDAVKSIKAEVQVLVWYSSEKIYTLMCDIGEEELMKIADNIDF